MSIQVTITDDGRVEGYLSSNQFAEKCGVDPNTIRVWIGRGKIADYIKIGSDYWISENEPKPGRKVRTHEDDKVFEAFYFVEDVANMLDVNQETVRRWIRSGALNAKMYSKKGGYRILASDLREFATHHSKKMQRIFNSKGL